MGWKKEGSGYIEIKPLLAVSKKELTLPRVAYYLSIICQVSVHFKHLAIKVTVNTNVHVLFSDAMVTDLMMDL